MLTVEAPMLIAVASEPLDWRELKQIAQQMPEASREKYLEHIEAAEKDSATAAKAQGEARWAELLHEIQPESLGRQVAPSLCGAKDTVLNWPLNLAVYTRMLERDVPWIEDYEPTETAKAFVNEFRRQLCIVKVCEKVKHDLIADKKLDCPVPN